MTTSKTEGKQCNLVNHDEIWKVHINMELESAKSWPQKWGFLTESYNQAMQESSKVTDRILKLELPEHLRTRPPTPPEEYLEVRPSPPVPQTTQAFIGWRSAVPGLQLERYGRVQCGKKSFLKELGWALDGCS
ncbi:ciliary microtubule inner protein 1-like isoform X1 [Conger conger]|uniref:ciliary microtubule inner protein 1-like isoform X1 n=2 Tax=Conger conger TaxID=82655 RepID=UPI002A5AB3DD|nr:ciliary microtubule inner protein 1-like isoform X1 [Conger conger]